jgi:hypothetical protein
MRDGLLGAVVVALSLAATPPTGVAADQRIERGRYLVKLGGCLDCHSRGYFFGKPDMAMFLGGSDVRDRGGLRGRERLRPAAHGPGLQDGGGPGPGERGGAVLAADDVAAGEPRRRGPRLPG